MHDTIGSEFSSRVEREFLGECAILRTLCLRHLTKPRAGYYRVGPTLPTRFVTGPLTAAPCGRLLADSGSLDAAPGAVEAAPIGLPPVAVVPVNPGEQPANARARSDPVAIIGSRIFFTFMIQAIMCRYTRVTSQSRFSWVRTQQLTGI